MRQSVITILIGAISTLLGFTATDVLRERRCTELGGAWAAVSRTCTLPSGEVVATGTFAIFTIGALVALAAAFLLYRTMLFAAGHMRRFEARR